MKLRSWVELLSVNSMFILNFRKKIARFCPIYKKFSIFTPRTLPIRRGQDQDGARGSPLALINSAMMLTPISSGVSE
jgi:hypothetical protein